ncbi:MAG TPA: hypothetical protein VGR37_08845 [Longimicrobiaceae bacterium]|nr:hypothetical protein [Longimicrobiaceae bacterium]
MAAHLRPDAADLRSLAEAAPGDLVEVVHILFGTLRHRYEPAGVRVGATLRLRERHRRKLVVELPSGALAEIDEVHAPFVEVRPLSAGTALGAVRAPTLTATPLADPARDP